MKKFFCPICGSVLEEEFLLGYICGCCGNESGFDDFQLFERAKIERELETNLFDDIIEYIPKEYIDKLRQATHFDDLEEKEYFDILRYIWVNTGCVWKYNHSNEKPNNWNNDIAEKQLLNLNLNLKDYTIIK